MSGVSVVVPVYCSVDTLQPLTERISAALRSVPHEIILVDDGSPPTTWSTIVGLAESAPNVRGLRLGRNYGQHCALVAGLREARYPITVTLDDDLQNPPEEIPRLLEALTDDIDVVYGTPPQLSHDRWRNATSRLAKRALASALGAENAQRMSTYRAFRTPLRESFEGALGPSVSLDALLGWSTSRFTWVNVRHDARRDGRSNYTVRRLVKYALDIATGYSSRPLHYATTLGFVTAGFGAVLLAWVLGRFILIGSSVPGFPFLASAVAIFAGVQLIALGVMGEYIARMHFRVMRKPTYYVSEQVGQRPEQSE